MSLVLSPPEVAPAPPGEPAPGRAAAWLVRWQLALRLARRDARRAKGRTALVLLMVGLPVLAIVAGDTLYRTGEISAVEALPARLGAADAVIQGVAREQVFADPTDGMVYQSPGGDAEPWTAAEVRALLPAGSELVERQTGSTTYRTGVGYATVQAYADDLRPAVRDGAFEVAGGRVPTRAGEVAISEAVAARGVGIGDRLQVTRDDVPLTVVGVLTANGQRTVPLLVVPPGGADLITGNRSTEYFASVPGGLSWPQVRALNAEGLVAVSRAVVLDPPPASAYLPPDWYVDSGAAAGRLAVVALIVAALLLEVVLLVGPAFAVGLRRQRRDLAMLAATGGAAADLRRTVLASGLVLGGGAAVLGALLGIGAAALGVPLLEATTDAAFGPFEVAPLDVLGIVAVGTAAGLLAAWVPARQAARTDVVTTLTGRRGLARSSWRLPVLGLVVAAAGLTLTVLGARGTELAVAGGAVLLVVGVVLTTPWLVGLLAPLAPRLPVAGRLAVRDATRNRPRTAPAVAAVMATVAGVTTLAIGSASDSAQARRDYVPQLPLGAASVSLWNTDADGWVAAARVVERQVPGRPVHEVRTAAWSEQDAREVWVVPPGSRAPMPEGSWFEQSGVFQPSAGIAVLDEAAAAALVPGTLGDPVATALGAGRVVVFGAGALDGDEVALEVTRWDGEVSESVGRVALPAVEVAAPAGVPFVSVPASVIVPPSLADRVPVELTTSQLVVGGPGAPLSAAEETRLTEAITALTGESSVYVERGWSDQLWLARLLLVLVGGALVLVATLTATGLAVADARPDHGTLAAIGAAPRTRRLMAVGSAAVIGLYGAVLGVLTGLAPGIAVAYPLTSTDYGMGANPVVVIPWDLLAVVVVAVPLLAVAVTGLAVRSRLPLATRIST